MEKYFKKKDFLFNIKTSLRFIPKNFKSKILFMVFLNFFSNLFELIGIFLVIPITALFLGIGKDDYFNNFEFLKYFGLSPQNVSLFSLSIIFFLIFFAKFIFSIFNQYYQFSLIKNLKNLISGQLIKNSYNKKWNNWINENKSNLYQNVINSADLFCYQYLLPFFLLVSEIIFLTIILLFFLYKFTYFTIIIIFLIFMIIYIYYRFFVRTYIYPKGKIRWFSDNKRIQFLNEIIISMKDIIIFDKKRLFYDKFFIFENKFNEANKFLGIFSQLPRIFLEFSFILLFLTLVILSSELVEEQKIKYFPYLASFFVLLIRIMPSINKILASIQQIKFSQKSVAKLNSNLKFEIKEIKTQKIKNIKFLKELRLKNISFEYQNSTKKIFSNLNLVIKKNSIVGIQGENGSGKSTLTDILAGLHQPTKGEVLCDNKNVIDFNWINEVAIISNRPLLINDSILNNILLGSKFDKKKLNYVINVSDLNSLIKKRKNGINSIIGDGGNLISSGQMQRLAISRALYAEKEILIFDEATNAIDSNSEKKIISSLLRIKNKTILIISHNEENFKYCDKVFKIINGKLKLINFLKKN